MMEKVFRSRGIRLLHNRDDSICEQQKIYYEPIDCKIDNRQIRYWMDENLLSLFEYSEVNGRVDTYNLHVKLEHEMHNIIYLGMDDQQLAMLGVIPTVFDISFKNYTVGYQIDNKEISRSAYYYYPTIWKEDHYGIKGIEDTTIITDEISRFADYVAVDKQSKLEIEYFGSIMYKLKGVSIHFRKDFSSYKLYGRCNQIGLQKLLADNMNVNIEKYDYGEVVLVAQRIQCGRVTGYNLYFTK